ncbi:hypothetical protein PA25_20400 [Pseudoalteromonas sp. A25]|uniref:hypothetical protein n=1 Tax=Pseudoalteromonas sp. A25 TaxID=116092 RepID=UPI001260A47D|nr:hypothetical protein [Pseudoalteromonas sp. A25]BBN82055.1 hypothetical protein PA25_20400 [Pseudoalteromonas sp. A25]
MQFHSSKVLKSLFCVASFMFITGCDKPRDFKSISYKSAQERMQETNQVLIPLPDKTASSSVVLPFTDKYLEKRHEVYNLVEEQALNNCQLDELNYLKIQERYPERYIMWPASVNVLDNAVSMDLNHDDINNWLQVFKAKLEEAQKSNIYLSRLELSRLKRYVSEQPVGGELLDYLMMYKPRNGIGLYQLPNGKEWYQSKLNFYYTKPVSPNSLLTQVQQRLASKPISVKAALNSTELNYALEVIKAHCDTLKPGLNWVDDYINLPATVFDCQLNLAEVDKLIVLALMEVDLGVHYQGWSFKQAKVTLQSRLELTDEQAYKLIEGIALYPASILTFLPKL